MPNARDVLHFLASALQALHKLSDKGIVEWAAFAATLAQRLARMLAAGLISPAHKLWNLAVDRVLIKAVDADTQVGVGLELAVAVHSASVSDADSRIVVSTCCPALRPSAGP